MNRCEHAIARVYYKLHVQHLPCPVFRYKNTEKLTKTIDRGSFFLGSSLRLFNPQHDPSKTGLQMKLSELRPGSRRIFMKASRWPRTQIPKHHQTPKALGSAPGVKNQQSSQTMSDLYQIYLHLSYLSYYKNIYIYIIIIYIYIHIYLWVIKSKSYQVVLSTVPTML